MTSVQQGSTTALESAVADASVSPVRGGRTLTQRVWDMEDQIAKALPQAVSPERFLRIVVTEIRETPRLLECTPESFLGAVMQSAQLGLEFGPLGLAYLVPFYNKSKRSMECQLIIGYKGLIDLARRSGNVKQIVARAVHQGDTFRVWTDENGDHLMYERGEGDRGEITKYFGLAVFTNGGSHVEVMSVDEITTRRERSASASKGFSPWTSDPEAMSKKTVIRAMQPWLPLTTEVTQRLAGDEQVNVYDDRTGHVNVQFIDPGPAANAREANYDLEAERESLLNHLNAIEPNAERLACSRFLFDKFGPIDGLTSDEIASAVVVVQGWPETGMSTAPPIHNEGTGEIYDAPSGSAPATTYQDILAELDDDLRADAEVYLAEKFGEGLDTLPDDEIAEDLEAWLNGDPNDASAPAQTPAQPQLAPTGDEPPWEPQGATGGLQGRPSAVSDEMLADTQKKVATWPAEVCDRVLGEWGLPKTGNLATKRLKLVTLLAPERAAGNPQATNLF